MQRGEIMGELYNPYPKLPKNIRQIGERDQVVKLYIEDYVNTYLKRLYPAGGQDLRVGLLLGEIRTEDGVPFLFIDGALEMEQVTREGEKVEFTEEAWKKAYQVMEQMFPHRSVQGWFLCGAPAVPYPVGLLEAARAVFFGEKPADVLKFRAGRGRSHLHGFGGWILQTPGLQHLL